MLIVNAPGAASIGVLWGWCCEICVDGCFHGMVLVECRIHWPLVPAFRESSVIEAAD